MMDWGRMTLGRGMVGRPAALRPGRAHGCPIWPEVR